MNSEEILIEALHFEKKIRDLYFSANEGAAATVIRGLIRLQRR